MDLKSNYPGNLSYAKSVLNELASTQNYQIKEDEENVKILLMLSGGIDSAALLVNLLSYTKCQVHVHHVQLADYNNAHRAELERVQKILDFCLRNIREFTYSFSFTEERYEGNYSCGLDAELWAFKAARICKSHRDFDLVALGLSDKRAALQCSDVFKTVVNCDGFMGSTIPQLILPRVAGDCDNVDIYESMPKELADICWSCRTPIKYEDSYVPCRTCSSCRKRSFTVRDLWFKSEYERHQDLLRLSWFSEKDKFLELVKQIKPDLTYLLIYGLENNFPNRRINLLLEEFAEQIQEEVKNDFERQDILNFMVLDSAWTQENFENRISFLVRAGAELDRVLAHDAHADKYYEEFVEYFKPRLDNELLTKAVLSMPPTDSNLTRVKLLIELGADKSQLSNIAEIYPELKEVLAA